MATNTEFVQSVVTGLKRINEAKPVNFDLNEALADLDRQVWEIADAAEEDLA